jgi:hypothetical protein
MFACADLWVVIVISGLKFKSLLYAFFSGLLAQRRQVARDIQHVVWNVCPNPECCWMERQGQNEHKKCPNSELPFFFFLIFINL